MGTWIDSVVTIMLHLFIFIYYLLFLLLAALSNNNAVIYLIGHCLCYSMLHEINKYV